nr:nucleotide-binding universal stress UspA family protein [Mucilaginibacter sp. X4EP1]
MMMNTLKTDGDHYWADRLMATLHTMKKFLFPTDFSDDAKHALYYGYNLAKQVKANVIICNAIIEPAEISQAGLVTWPIEESDMLLKDSHHELSSLKQHLENKAETISYNPTITCMEQAGTVLDVVNGITHDKNIGLVIIGTHGSNGLSTLLLGNHSRSMIDEINKPLLLVPPAATITPVKKIAFATDFQDPAYDLNCIINLITLARPLNAEILVTNIFDDGLHNHEVFMKELTARANYPLLYYRLVKAYKPEAGLDWLCEHGQIDILAMVHRDHTFIDSLFRGSLTQKMANHIPIPLLVFPTIIN